MKNNAGRSEIEHVLLTGGLNETLRKRLAFELEFEGDARLRHSETVHEGFVGRYDSLITDQKARNPRGDMARHLIWY